MKCLVKDCKNRSLLMTVELCYPCSQLIEKGVGNDFKPDWDTVKPYLDRIAELEERVNSTKVVVERKWVNLTDKEMERIWDITPPEYEDRFAFAKAVEAKLKELNT